MILTARCIAPWLGGGLDALVSFLYLVECLASRFLVREGRVLLALFAAVGLFRLFLVEGKRLQEARQARDVEVREVSRQLQLHQQVAPQREEVVDGRLVRPVLVDPKRGHGCRAQCAGSSAVNPAACA